MNKMVIGATAIVLIAGPASALAWEAKAYYPSAITPTMPSADEAVRVTAQPPLLLRSVRHAYREAKRRGWVGVPPLDSGTEKQPSR